MRRYRGACLVLGAMCVVMLCFLYARFERSDGEGRGVMSSVRVPVKMGDDGSRATVVMSPVLSERGNVLGFHVELFNQSKDEYLVLAMPGRGTRLFLTKVFDEEKKEVLLMPEMDRWGFGKVVDPESVARWCMIHPGTGHSWFVPVPAKVMVGVGKDADIPKGKYFFNVQIQASSYMRKFDELNTRETRKYLSIETDLPQVEGRVDAADLKDVNLVEAYLKGKEGRGVGKGE